MKPWPFLPLILAACKVCTAGPEERAILAAMALSERPSYSWTSTVTDDARSYDVAGKTELGGFTWLRLPLVKSIAQRLGRYADPEVEAFFNGSTRCVIHTERGWQLLSELPRRGSGGEDESPMVWPGPMTRGHMGMATLGGFPPASAISFPAGPSGDDDDAAYSNAQFAAKLPHEELAIIVSSFTDLRCEGDSVTGVLSDTGAQLLLVSDGQNDVTPLVATGTFRLQLAGDIVTRYGVQLEGVLLVGRKKIHVRQSATTVVKDVGKTKLVVPDEVRRKLLP